MPNILIRDLEPELAEGLKTLAKQRHRSVQAELHELIAQAVRSNAARQEAIRELRALRDELRLTGKTFSDSTELIREDRER